MSSGLDPWMGRPKAIDVAIALIGREGRWFLQRRDPAAEVLPGLWEFPGGKVEGQESPEAALRRELREEVGWEPQAVEALPSLVHAYPELVVTLHPFRCVGPGEPATDLAWGWFLPYELEKLAMPAANQGLVLLIQKGPTAGLGFSS